MVGSAADTAVRLAVGTNGQVLVADSGQASGLSYVSSLSLTDLTVSGTVTGIDKTDVGLANVDNTSDAAKPVSTATQTALNLKAPLASPAFTGTLTIDTDVNLKRSAADVLKTDDTFEVAGNLIVANNQALQWRDSGGTARRIALRASSGTIYYGDIDNATNSALLLFAGGTGSISLYTNGSERVTIDSGGKVGIGTASPATQIHVAESGTATGTRGITIGQHNAGINSPLFNFQKSRGTIGSPASVANGDYVGAFGFNSYETSTYRSNAGFGAIVNGTVASDSVPADLFFWTSAAHEGDPVANNKVGIRLTSLGSVVVGRSAALATNATDGFIYLPSSAGTPTGAPVAQTGKVACQIDTTNSKFYAYIGGAWKSVTLA